MFEVLHYGWQDSVTSRDVSKANSGLTKPQNPSTQHHLESQSLSNSQRGCYIGPFFICSKEKPHLFFALIASTDMIISTLRLTS